MKNDWRWGLVVITLTVAAFGKGQAATGDDVCTASNRTRMIATLEGGTRVLLALERNGDRLTGMATLWLANGQMPARGPVTGMFGGRELDDVTRGFTLAIHWQAPTNADSDLSGLMNRGTGRGQGGGFKGTSTAPVPFTIRTPSGCARWPQEYYLDASGRAGTLPAPPHTCVTGYVWREAHPWDRVCVTPATRERTAIENRQAPALYEWRGGAGANNCKLGSFERRAYPGDTTCAGVQSGVLAARDNELAPHRAVNEADGQIDQSQIPYCKAYAADANTEVKRSITLGCAVDGPRWALSQDSHYDWCMSSMLASGAERTKALSTAESDARKNANLRCQLAARPRVAEQPGVAGARDPKRVDTTQAKVQIGARLGTVMATNAASPAASATTESSSSQVSAARPASFVGFWDTVTGAGNHYQMSLMQAGSRVTGHYSPRNGTIDGTVGPRGRLTYRWTEGSAHGTGIFVLGEDGRSFEGSYSNSDDPTAVSGTWKGTRK